MEKIFTKYFVKIKNKDFIQLLINLKKLLLINLNFVLALIIRNESLNQTHQVKAHCVEESVSIMSLGLVHT